MGSLFKKFFKKNKSDSFHNWEYFNRYNFTIQELKSSKLDGASILSVGDSKSANVLGRFAVKNVTIMDISADCDVSASADKIPFKDNSFDVVVCIDTLEHIPRNLRNAVTDEVVRVAKKLAIIIAPVDSVENNRAEELVYEFMKTGYIREHRQMGLVNFDEIRSRLNKNPKISCIKEKDLDDLLYWAANLIGDKLDSSELYQKLYFLENKFNPRRKAFSVIMK